MSEAEANVRAFVEFLEARKKKLKENVIKSIPVFGIGYSIGKKAGTHAGKKEGYTEASSTYEEKLISQAEEFLKQKESFMQMKRDRDLTLDEYEEYIKELENMVERITKQQFAFLGQLKEL